MPQEEGFRAGHLPNWTLITLPGGRPGVIRTDVGGNVAQVCVQFSDKTATVISRRAKVKLVQTVSALVYERLGQLDAEFFEKGKADVNQSAGD